MEVVGVPYRQAGRAVAETSLTVRRAKSFLVAAIIVATAGSSFQFSASGVAPAACMPPHRFRVLDLGMLPDPAQRGQRIQLWAVTLRSDYNAECLAVLEVRDRDQIVGRRLQYLIKPGTGRYTFQAEPSYRFQLQEHCLTVLANVADTWVPVKPADSQRLFCARYRPQPPPGGWSLK
jgi:hypothetical protein